MSLNPADVPAPACPSCSAPVDIDWIEIQDLGSAAPDWVPGRRTCTGNRYHDVRAVADDITPIRIVHPDLGERVCCRLTLATWRDRGWRPVDPELMTPAEMVEQRVEDLKKQARLGVLTEPGEVT